MEMVQRLELQDCNAILLQPRCGDLKDLSRRTTTLDVLELINSAVPKIAERVVLEKVVCIHSFTNAGGVFDANDSFN